MVIVVVIVATKGASGDKTSAYRDGRVRRTELDRIGEKIPQHLSEFKPIRVDDIGLLQGQRAENRVVMCLYIDGQLIST